MKAINNISLKFETAIVYSKETDLFFHPDEIEKKISYTFIIQIDEKPIHIGYQVDLYAILELAIRKEDAKDYFYFWNCGCGVPECANIECGKILKDDGFFISVLIPDVISYSSYSNELQRNYEYWEKNHKMLYFKFSKQQLSQELWDFCNKLDADLQRTSGNYTLMSWPTMDSNCSQYELPCNLPNDIKKELVKSGFLEKNLKFKI